MVGGRKCKEKSSKNFRGTRQFFVIYPCALPSITFLRSKSMWNRTRRHEMCTFRNSPGGTAASIASPAAKDSPGWTTRTNGRSNGAQRPGRIAPGYAKRPTRIGLASLQIVSSINSGSALCKPPELRSGRFAGNTCHPATHRIQGVRRRHSPDASGDP